MARTMMRHKDVDQDLWADAIKTAVYIKNRVTSRALSVGKTPFELWTGNKPNVSHMREFGSTCWVVLHKSHIDGNFGEKAAKAVFLGYPDGSKAYKFIFDDGKVVKTRSVVFAETNVSEVAEVAEELPGDKTSESRRICALQATAKTWMLTMTTRMTIKTMDLISPRTTTKVVAALKTRCVGAAERGDPLSSTEAR